MLRPCALRSAPSRPALPRLGGRRVLRAHAASGWRVERQRVLGLGLAPARFALAPTDACSPGSCIAWALFFAACPPPARVEAALEALLEAYPLLAARPAARCELEMQPGAGVPFEVAAWDDDLDAVLGARLGFAHAAVDFTQTPRKQLPFLCLPDHAAMDARKEALVGARLTRLADGGGVLAVTFSHLLADGQRCVTLLSALAAACRGEALPQGLTHDRSALWPEALAAHPAVASILREAEAEEAAGASPPGATVAPPRDSAECAAPASPPPPSSWSLLPLHVPGASLAALSSSLAPLAPGLRLSAHDALAGLVWTLRCALAGTGLPGEPCSGRFIVALDLAGNGLPPGVLPADFSGNCAAALSVAAPDAGGPDDAAAAVPEAVRNAAPRQLLAVARAAGAVRNAVTSYRSQPRNAVRHLLACGARGARAVAAAPGAWRGGDEQPLVGYATSCLRVPLPALDCGTGAPAALHYSTLPLRSASGLLFASLAPGPRGDGALVLLAAGDAHAAALTSKDGPAAEVLRIAAPGARLLV